jgi:hypothetical protein
LPLIATRKKEKRRRRCPATGVRCQ